MEGRIAHLRSHYRLVGAQAAAAAVVSSLDRVLCGQVIQRYEESLQSALAGDESVYVVRRVKASTRIILGSGATDAGLAKNWGSHLAAAVMRAIAGAADDPGNVVRFENQADYVASYIVSLLKGSAHGQWVYESFITVQPGDRNSAIRRVLLDNVSHVPAVLAYVHRYGEIDSLIAALDTETRRALWSPEFQQRDDQEISRSLFTTALQFLEKLGAWTGPPQHADELFHRYCETGPPFADWRDPRSLAESVFEVVRYFFARGHLSSVTEVGELSFRVREALEDFEWLDREWLSSSVRNLFDKHDRTTPDLPLRASTGRATPRQRELLAAIAAAVGDAPAISGDPLAAALKILALLVADAPGWAEDAAAKVMIENLLAARTAAAGTSSRGEFVNRLRRRDVEGALRMLPVEQREVLRDACRAVASLGEPALELLDKLAGTEAKQLVGGIETECAGPALLIRTLLDARLHAFPDEDSLPVQSEWPPVLMLFILVAHRITGGKAFVDGGLERGLCLLTGIERPPTLDELHAIWREADKTDHSQFRKALLRIAAGQRLIDAEDDMTSVMGSDWRALEEADEGKTGNPNLDLTITIVTCLLLRMWSRWLRGFSTSSPAFLIENFVCRRGRLYAEKDALVVELERRPLDVVMEMAGYLSDLERVPWLPAKRIRFSLVGS